MSASIVAVLPRVVIVPGNGCSPVLEANWYKWMRDCLRETIWLPFIQNELRVDDNTILIGHSSGAVAGLRLLENVRLLGCVLVAACHTDLGALLLCMK